MRFFPEFQFNQLAPCMSVNTLTCPTADFISRKPSWGWVWHVLALNGLGSFRCLYLWMAGPDGQDDAEEWLKELLRYNREATPRHR